MKTNLILKSGRVVVRNPMSNSTARTPSMADGGDMSEAEWEEICILIRKETQAHAAKLRRQARDSAMRDCGLVKVRGAMGGAYWE